MKNAMKAEQKRGEKQKRMEQIASIAPMYEHHIPKKVVIVNIPSRTKEYLKQNLKIN